MSELIKKYQNRVNELDAMFFSETTLYKSVKIKAEIDALNEVIKDLQNLNKK